MQSSVTSGFKFTSYKIDKIDFNVITELGILSSNNHSNCDINFNLGFRNAIKFIDKENNSIKYVTGLQVQISIFNKDTNKEIANGVFIITGLFTTDNTFTQDIESNLIKHQAPTILFPYVRATISTTLSSAGFSTIILPLINVAGIAEQNVINIEEREI